MNSRYESTRKSDHAARHGSRERERTGRRYVDSGKYDKNDKGSRFHASSSRSFKSVYDEKDTVEHMGESGSVKCTDNESTERNGEFCFTKYKYELSKVFSANANLVRDTEDFWKFVKKYESVQKKLSNNTDGTLSSDLNSIGVPTVYHKSHCINLEISYKFGELFSRIPPTSELTKHRLLKFKEIVILYLDFKQKEKFTKLKKLREAQANLPVAQYKEQIIEAVKTERVVIIAGDTGCGKSTQVPQYLYSAGYLKIACTQPRRIACISLAKRVAFETLTENRNEVGYQIRFEKQRNQDTKITFITEGLLLRQLSGDSGIPGYDVVVLDEVHERHLHGDFLLGIMKCIIHQKDDLKLVLMSATINIQLFSNYFAKENVKVIQVPGRLYPIQLLYRPITIDDIKYKNDRFNPSPYVQILHIIDQKYPVDEKGDLLIFLSGMSEITAVVDAAKEYSLKKNNWIVLPLHSSLSIAEQDKVFDYPPDGMRKCIVSTNIAETSITIDGIRFVADSGKVKEMSYDPSCKMQRLKEFWISKASAEQRKGRAGRTGPGVCYRIYSEEEYKGLEKYSTPEIQRVPLDSLLLQMMAMGLPDARKFPFIEPPPPESIENSILSLKEHAALTENEKLTCIGKTLARLPVDITIGKMLIMGSIFHQVEPVLSLAAALSIQTPFTNRAYRDVECESSRKKLESDHGDPITLLNAFKEWLEVKQQSSQEFRGSGSGSRKWCKRRGLEEQRFYEMTKLRSQFKELLQDCSLMKGLPEPNSTMTSAERAIRHGELKLLKSLKRTYKQSAPRKRKQLKPDSFEIQLDDNDNDDGEIDIKDVEFRMRNDQNQVQNLLTAATACSYKDLTMLKLILCSGLYPQFACADDFNYCKSVSEQLFHTKAKPYVALHPMSFFGNHPQILQLEEVDIVSIPGFRSKTPVSPKHELLAYLSLLETTKPYLVNTLRMPAAQTLLLFAREIDTNSSFAIIVCDSWLALEFPVPDSGQTLLMKATKLRQKWDFLLNQRLQESNTKSEEKQNFSEIEYDLTHDLIEYMHTTIPYTIKRLLPADLKTIYVGNGGNNVCINSNPFDADFEVVTNNIKGGCYVTDNITYNCVRETEWTDRLAVEMCETEWHCQNCDTKIILNSMEKLQHQAICTKSEVKDIKEKIARHDNARFVNNSETLEQRFEYQCFNDISLALTLLFILLNMYLLLRIIVISWCFIVHNGQEIVELPVTTTTTTTPIPTTIPIPNLPGVDTSRSYEKPRTALWTENKDILMDWLLTGCTTLLAKKCSKYRDIDSIEYPGYDGWYNNIGRPESGAVDTPLLRRWPAAYEDGVYKPSGSKRPQPLELSEKLLNGGIGTKSRTGRNALLVFFGQQVVEEILDAQRPACPPEYFNIDIPKDHPYRKETGHTQMPVLRTRFDMRTGYSPNNPRQQLNEITPYLDGGLMYGTSKAWSDVLRTYANNTFDPNGLLATSDSEGLFPEYNTARLPMANPPPPRHHDIYIKQHHTERVTRYFKLGNPRGNENPFLLTFGILWFRWHNHLARHIKRLNPDWPGEKIYNEARKWVIATQQHIVVNRWLPQWLGANLSEYKGYDPSIDPQIDQFFQAAAFRFGHTLVPPGVYLRDYGRNGCRIMQNGKAIRTCNNYWMSQNSLFENKTKLDGVVDIERLIMGMVIQLTEKEDHRIVDDLRVSLFGPLEFSRRDLMAINIQRAREHGLPDYNTARMAYNLPRVNNVSHFRNVDPEYKEEFLRLHNNSFDDVDIWVGGIMETEDGPGELFRAIIVDQFERIRAADRFWYKNVNNKLFTLDEIKRLEQLSFYDILLSITKMDPNDIPRNPYRVPASDKDIHPNCIENNVVIQGACRLFNYTHVPCYHAEQIDSSKVENCTKIGTYDYFSNSSASFILTFAGVTAFFCGFVTFVFFKLKFKQQKEVQLQVKQRKSYLMKEEQTTPMFTANEWQDHKIPSRPVIVSLNVTTKQVEVKNQLGNLLRAVDFTHASTVILFTTSDSNFVVLRVHHNYDLVLKFDSDYLRSLFVQALSQFMSEVTQTVIEKVTTMTAKSMLKQVVTKLARQKKLEKFFRVVFAQAFHIAHTVEEMLQIDSHVAKEVIYTELTIIEFAEALSMTPDSEFVKKIFNLVDKDKNGFISFREFVDMLVIFLKGSAEEKMKLMFDMYDINSTGTLKREDFTNMLRSFMETVNADVTDSELEALVQSMMDHANIATKESINLQDFQLILSEFNDKLNYAELEFNVSSDGKNKKLHAGVSTIRSTFIGEVKKTVESLYADPNELRSRIEGKVEMERQLSVERSSEIIDRNEKIVEEVVQQADDYWYPLMKYLGNKRLQIFWISLYTLLLLGIFAERVYYYSVEREHTGLRRILGYGLTITRGAASAMMFTFSSLLVMMCHNTVTILRDTFLRFYIPFDSMIEMHKYIACWALVFTVLHIIGHGFNFYHISTQTADDLTCLFRNYFHATHELPKFHYWCWQTMTGVTGILLTIVGGLIYICSVPIVRRTLYNWFSLAHSLYPIFYILMVLHGTGRLVQEPFFHYFFLGPVILFIIDKLVTVTRNTVEIPILKADILPSGVTCITFPKPSNFQYKCGQWVRIACPALQTNEYHPFTLSSAPHEPNLTIHIRAVGAWTINIRNTLDPSMMLDNTLPKIHVDGPYGESHQDWDKYDVAIMVGGGIGVTPFASILKDIVFKSNHNINVGCKKVYFLWVTRTQKQFEWMVDILRELEKADINNTVSVHVFITQFYHKFDLRTILLYICERHFQRVSNKSLFTGLTAITHFGRPKFNQFFLSITKLHPTINKIGVFSCGTQALTQAVDTACKSLNTAETNDTLFQHHFKSF
ncbi:hypothetical protein KM043_013488 [Ampulex compressa]|nr:hypothetical protein KM043_013488 [Ampulex compressa]